MREPQWVKCRNCKCWAVKDGVEARVATCHRHPPQVVYANYRGLESHYPETRPTDGCWDGVPREVSHA